MNLRKLIDVCSVRRKNHFFKAAPVDLAQS